MKIVVFEDGETWARATSARVVDITDAEQLKMRELRLSPRQLGLDGPSVEECLEAAFKAGRHSVLGDLDPKDER